MPIKIRIQNDTVWQTKTLRPFIARIAREEFPGTKLTNTRRRVTVRISYTRGGGGYSSGCAYYHSEEATVSVPHPKHGPFPLIDFCVTVAHEFAHCRGVRHQQMGLHYRRGEYANQHFAWALQLPEPKPKEKPKARTTNEKRAAALQAAHRAVKRWTSKAKLADTKLRYWRRRVKVLERRVAVSTAPVYISEQEGGQVSL